MDTTTLTHRLREFLKTKASPFSSATGLIHEAEAALDNLQASLNEMHIRAVEAAADRASIVAFLDAEATHIDRTAAVFDAALAPDSADRCRTKAGHTRTLAAQIARGDDRQGGE